MDVTCGVYSRAATIRSAVFIRGNMVYIYQYFSKPLRLLGNSDINTVNYNSVLRVTCPCCFVCVCVL